MIDDVYNAHILELAGNIPCIGRLEKYDATANAHSRICGSKVTVWIRMDGDRVIAFAHDVKACALGQASASVMARNVIGASAEEIRQAREALHAMLKEDGQPPRGCFGDLKYLQPVKDYKARHPSTMLAFDAVVDCLDQIAAGTTADDKVLAS